MTATLRPMTRADLPTILVMERAIYDTDAWDERSFREELRNPRKYGLVLEEAGAIIGYGSIWETGKGHGSIANIAVAATSRGQGSGARLLDALLEEAVRREMSDIDLDVRVSNTVAQGLYASRGFTVLARKRGYYLDNGEDAYLMGRSLAQVPYNDRDGAPTP